MPTCPNPKCQVEVNEGANFCTICGYNLSADTPSPAESQRESEIFARRVSANDIEESAFSSSLVIRPGSFGIEIRDSMVTGVLSIGRQTVDGIMDRLHGLFSSDSKKEVVIIDERPVILALNTNVPNQTLRIFLNAETGKDALSILVERVVGDKKQVNALDLQTLVKKFLNENFSAAAIGDGDDVEIQKNIHDALINQFGLDAAFEMDRGLPRHHFDLTVGVSEIDEMVCLSCGENILPNVKYCTQCGVEQDPASTSSGLVSKDLISLVADISIVVEIEEAPSESAMKNSAKVILGRLLREHEYEALDQRRLSQISIQLHKELTNQLDFSEFGRITSATLLDVKTLEGDWKLRTRAAVENAQGVLEASKAMMGVEAEKIDVQEIAKRIALRRQKMEAEVAFDQDQQALEDRTRRQSMEDQNANLDIQDAQRDSKRVVSIDDATRESDRTITTRDRSDELSELEHNMELERQTATHDADLGSIAGDAESAQKKRQADDETYVEKQTQDLKLEKLSRMVDLDDRVAAREEQERKAREDHEIVKAEQERKSEAEKRDQLRGLSTEQILAMQAGELAGKDQDVASIASSISGTDAEKEKAELQEKLFREMLDREQSSREDMKDLMKHSIDGVKEGEAKTTQAHKDAAAQARSMSEKSMESMAKVTSSAAAAKAKADKKNPETRISSARNQDCVNPECGKKIVEGAEFCGECGSPQASR